MQPSPPLDLSKPRSGEKETDFTILGAPEAQDIVFTPTRLLEVIQN